jgi:hypothetical protein
MDAQAPIWPSMSVPGENDLVRLKITPDLAWQIACGRMNLFPPDTVRELVADLGRRLDVYVPSRECEAAVAIFVAALIRDGWLVCRPASDFQK